MDIFEILDIGLLVIAYTCIVLTLFLEMICYKRNIETLETIYLTVSLLLLIIALSTSYFFESLNTSENINIYILLSMILVGLTTVLNVLEERQHKIKPVFRKGIIGFSALLFVMMIVGYFTKTLYILENITVAFLTGTIIFSMILTRKTKPKVKIAHREKIERIISMMFLIFVPLFFCMNYFITLNGINTKTGFTLPLVFIILSISKLWDDIERLSLFKPENTAKEQNLKNYAFTKREKEVVQLLIKGKTYIQISEELFISVPTVKTHVSNIYKKSNANNRTELISLVTS